MFLFNLNAEIVACMLSENLATGKIWKIFPNMVFPRFRGKKWRRSEHAHVSYPELFFRHSRPQRPRSFWSAPRIATSDLVQHRKSAIHGLPVTLRMFRVKSDKSDWFCSQSIVFSKPFKNGMSLDRARGRDSWY